MLLYDRPIELMWIGSYYFFPSKSSEVNEFDREFYSSSLGRGFKSCRKSSALLRDIIFPVSFDWCAYELQ
ncbi:hypothetical protein Ple7327_3314 [Pleurocapsa sp. PCC 7327]|nr:hypothetical protein Ple7327_3314 [Pleurocapsa sp. PCC 7327]